MEKLYYFPSASKKGYSNPYSIHYKKALEQYYNVLDKDNISSKILSWTFLKNTFIADIFIVNWLENVPFFKLGYIQYLLVLIGLKIIQWRQKTVIWMFHNIHPHQGENKYSRNIQKILFNQSKLIISHSEEAASYAQEKAGNKVYYKCHPIAPIEIQSINKEIEKCDVLIWGEILPYKGIYELISHPLVKNAKFRIRIIGSCRNVELKDKITSACNHNITFENRRIDFDELALCIKKSRYVLFPYIGDCVSSSGAVIDSIVLNGTPIGSYLGAFKDLESFGVCKTYHSYSHLIEILNNDFKIDEESRRKFLENNSWNKMSEFIFDKINNL